MIGRISKGLALGAALFLLVACDSAEERAEKHYQAALRHLENGDHARATIEFRNVFELNTKHKEARLAYARMRLDEGNAALAYGQYLHLVEQYPDNLEGRRALARLATLSGDWEEAERHVGPAARLAPQDPVVRAVLVSIAYRDAIGVGDETAIGDAVGHANGLVEEAPELVIPHFIIASEGIRQQDWPIALAALDAAIAASPDTRRFHDLRIGVLSQMGEADKMGPALEEMVRLFPGDQNIQNGLIAWYMSRSDLEAAETFLRQRINPAEANPKSRIDLLQFLATSRGTEEAIAEIDAMLAEELPHRPKFQTLRAGLVFQSGDPETAIDDLKAMIAASEPSADLNDAKVVLAHMLIETGEEAEAYALADEVLAEDGGQTGAAKIKASQLIEDDRTGDAIVLLRAALGDSPRDAELMTLLARAHERGGNHDLMADMLARAVEASGQAPGESQRYAEYLAGAGRNRAAADILIEAVGNYPDNVQLLARLGQIHIQGRDWRNAQEVIDKLKTLGSGAARAQAQMLTANLIAAQGQNSTLLSYLETLAGGADYIAEIGIVRLHVRNNDLQAALDYLDRSLEETPSDFVLRFLRASVLAGMGGQDESIRVYRALLDEQPESERVWMAYYLLLGNTDPAQAALVLEQALAALPDSANLKWMQAGALEAAGDIEGAIGIYEGLYATNSASLVVANNLASLLATAHDDPDSLDRAFNIARRLRNSRVPHFSDTYGWIAYRRGNYEDALVHLEVAEDGLPDDPVVLYHLGVTYVALDLMEKARVTLNKAAGLASQEDLAQKVQQAIRDLPTGDESTD